MEENATLKFGHLLRWFEIAEVGSPSGDRKEKHVGGWLGEWLRVSRTLEQMLCDLHIAAERSPLNGDAASMVLGAALWATEALGKESCLPSHEQCRDVVVRVLSGPHASDARVVLAELHSPPHAGTVSPLHSHRGVSSSLKNDEAVPETSSSGDPSAWRCSHCNNMSNDGERHWHGRWHQYV